MKKCIELYDFSYTKKNTSVPIDELLIMNKIQGARKTLRSLFFNIKSIPDIQKVHSITVIDINKVECKFYANSHEKTIVSF